MTSEEEISVASSPLVTRRRMGSFSGPSADPAGLGGAPGAGDTYSPGQSFSGINNNWIYLFSKSHIVFSRNSPLENSSQDMKILKLKPKVN